MSDKKPKFIESSQATQLVDQTATVGGETVDSVWIDESGDVETDLINGVAGSFDDVRFFEDEAIVAALSFHVPERPADYKHKEVKTEPYYRRFQKKGRKGYRY